MLRLKLLPAVFFIMAAAIVMTQATLVAVASEECRPQPGASGPTGSRWYYRVDRVNQRRCWYLSSSNSHLRQASLLRRRALIRRSTTEGETAQQFALDDEIVAGPTRRKEPVVLPEEQTHPELVKPELDALSSTALVPHKVTSISYFRPQSGEQSFGRGTNLDFVFICGALTTALLVAGGAFQVISQIRRPPRSRQYSAPSSQPGGGAERQRISISAVQYRSLSFGRPWRQGVAKVRLRRSRAR